MQFLIKIILSGLIIAGVSELAKKNTAIAAIVIALPLMTILSMIWIYLDTRDLAKISAFSINILLAVIPTLLFFMMIPLFIKLYNNFIIALSLSIFIMIIVFLIYAFVLSKFGIKL